MDSTDSDLIVFSTCSDDFRNCDVCDKCRRYKQEARRMDLLALGLLIVFCLGLWAAR